MEQQRRFRAELLEQVLLDTDAGGAELAVKPGEHRGRFGLAAESDGLRELIVRPGQINGADGIEQRLWRGERQAVACGRRLGRMAAGLVGSQPHFLDRVLVECHAEPCVADAGELSESLRAVG
jgi:hypothetical protein